MRDDIISLRRPEIKILRSEIQPILYIRDGVDLELCRCLFEGVGDCQQLFSVPSGCVVAVPVDR